MNPELLKACFILIAAVSFASITQHRQIKRYCNDFAQRLLSKNISK